MTQDSNDEKAVVPAGEGGPLTVFLTGGAGPLGESVTRRLTAQGHRVYATAATAADAQALREAGGLPVYVDLTRGSEIASALRMAKAQVIAHLAAQQPNGLPYQARDWDADHLRASAAALVEAVQAVSGEEAAPPFIVYPGYAFVYAPSGHDSAAAEDAPLAEPGDNPLLQAALAIEATLRDSGLPLCVLRLGFIYGPHMAATRDFAETLRAGRPISAGEGRANWVYSEDAAAAITSAIVQQPGGAVYNITGDEAASTLQFMADFAAEMGLQLPEGLLLRIGRLFTGREANALLSLDAAASNAAAKAGLGWQPQYPTPRRGIAQTLLIWRAEGLPQQG